MTTTDVTGKVTVMKNDKDEESKRVMPRDRVKMIVPVAFEQGIRFAIRGGKTFGVGVNNNRVNKLPWRDLHCCWVFQNKIKLLRRAESNVTYATMSLVLIGSYYFHFQINLFLLSFINVSLYTVV